MSRVERHRFRRLPITGADVRRDGGSSFLASRLSYGGRWDEGGPGMVRVSGHEALSLVERERIYVMPAPKAQCSLGA